MFEHFFGKTKIEEKIEVTSGSVPETPLNTEVICFQIMILNFQKLKFLL